MSCTAAKRALVITTSSLLFGWSGGTQAASAGSETAVVAMLYKDYAWQAMATQRGLFGEDLAHQSKAVLEKYFAPPLTNLLLRDAACQVARQGVCNLESDVLFNSQDPRVTDLEVAKTGPGKVSVSFKDPVDASTTRIDFEVVRIAGRWKIADIVYQTPERYSLERMLSRRIK